MTFPSHKYPLLIKFIVITLFFQLLIIESPLFLSDAGLASSMSSDWPQLVNSTRMMTDIEKLTSDDFGGRYPGSLGDNLTLDYLNGQLSLSDVSPLGVRSDLLQPVPIDPWSITVTPINLTLNDNILVYGVDYIDWPLSGNVSLTSPTDLIFYQEYDPNTPNVNFTGKLVLVPFQFQSASKIWQELIEKKAAAVIFTGGTLLRVSGCHKFYDPNFGLLYVTSPALSKYGILLSGNTRVVGTGTLTVTAQGKPNVLTANVLGQFPAADTAPPHSTIIVSAHHDMLGRNLIGEIYSGAIDDASGVTVVLEVARVLTEYYGEGKFFGKSVVFALWGAEEMLLVGSEYYTNHPLFPLEQIDLNLNIDEVGLSSSELRVITEQAVDQAGFEVPSSYELPAEILTALIAAGTQHGQLTTSSLSTTALHDAVSFCLKGVSAVTLCQLGNPAYHTPQDTIAKINPVALEKVTLSVLGYLIEYLGTPIPKPTTTTTTTMTTTTTTTTTTTASGFLFLPSLCLLVPLILLKRKKKNDSLF